MCPAGRRDDGSEACAACAPGRSQPLSGEAACGPCAADAYSAADGASCIECAPGRTTSGAAGLVAADCAARLYEGALSFSTTVFYFYGYETESRGAW